MDSEKQSNAEMKSIEIEKKETSSSPKPRDLPNCPTF